MIVDRASSIRSSEDSTLRILVMRPDRIGDVILSTPVFQVIKQHYPKAHLTVMVRSLVAPLIRGLPFVDEVIIYDPEGKHAGVRGFLTLVRQIRRRRFRIAVSLQSNWKIAAAVFMAQIRYRVGPLSKLHSFIFYNRGIRQHRSQVEMHEADYNLQLLRRLGIRATTRKTPTAVAVSDEVKESARQWLEDKNWDPTQPLVIVHPGMGGSALNWPETHYLDLIRSLVRDGRQVLVTGGGAEVSLLDRIREALGPLASQVMFYGGLDTGVLDPSSVESLGGLFHWGTVVIAPSTGPLHLAVALGRNVVTFYPPVRVQSALRWGPYLKDESKASVLVPEVYCGQDFKCRGNLCNYFPCMKGLTVNQALEQVNQQITQVQQES